MHLLLPERVMHLLLPERIMHLLLPERIMHLLLPERVMHPLLPTHRFMPNSGSLFSFLPCLHAAPRWRWWRLALVAHPGGGPRLHPAPQQLRPVRGPGGMVGPYMPDD